MLESAREFARLALSDDPVDRRRSTQEDAPIAVWIELIEKHEDLRFWVANNRTVPIDVLRILVKDNDWRVRDRVASKNSCPPELLELLSSDGHDAVASTVAGHPNTPTRALHRLAEHPWAQVREKAIGQLATRGEG
jgi:hypothetical protein